MSKTLIIAEKPSVARDIASAIGKVAKNGDFFENDQFVISSAVGHLVELFMPQDFDKKYGRWTLDTLPIIPEQFGLKPIEKTKSQFNLVKKLMARKDVDLVVNACDAGREGELIFTYLYELAGCTKPFKRLWMQSMTPQSIRDAFEALRAPEQMNALQQAARSRSEADWLVGINGTRAITKRLYGSKVKEIATVGRVQTPTLTMVLERELEIRNFKPTPYWKIVAKFGITAGTYEGTFQKEGWSASKAQNDFDKADTIWDEKTASEILARVQAISSWEVSEKVKRAEQMPPKLYDLTSLQRDANTRFGFSAASTLKVAQSLYEKHKALTYPRTDSRALPEDYVEVSRRTLTAVGGEFGAKAVANGWVHPTKRIFNNAGISDHFAIIPTGQTPGKLTEPEEKIYDMVLKRFIAVFYPAAQIDNTTRLTVSEGLTFKTEGKVLVEPGWMEVYGRESLGSEPLVGLTEPDQNRAALKSAESQGAETRPPARYTDATLLTAMETAGKKVDDEDLADAMKERGLGTPATRAAIIDHLINTTYIERQKRELVPTAKAETLYDFLKVLKAEALTRPDLTGEWEYRLRQMEEKKLSREDFMAGIVELTKSIVAAVKAYQEADEEATPTTVISPTDGKVMVEKARMYESQDGQYKVWKVISGHRLTQEELSELLAKGEIGPIDGFVSKFGRKFSAKLKLDENRQPRFDFGDNPNIGRQASMTPEELHKGEKVGVCPKCGADVYAYEGGWICEKAIGEKPKCGFRLNKVLLQQELPQAEVVKLLSGEETAPMSDFVSKKTGKKFTAILYIRKANGMLGWKFPPRPKKPKLPKGATKTEEKPTEKPSENEPF